MLKLGGKEAMKIPTKGIQTGNDETITEWYGINSKIDY